jgi:SAM-dependent methyltransferase
MPPRPPHVATIDDVLQFYLSHSPPDHALWKTIEWRLFREYDYPAPVLDLGCGDGVFAELVFDHQLDAGLDILPNRVRKAHRAGVYRLALTADATRIPFAPNSFATIFSGCAMEHVPPMPQMLSEIARVLKPGGQLITTVPSGYFSQYLYLPGVLRRRGYDSLAERYGTLIARLLTIWHLYHPARWRELLDDAGLELIEARHFLPPPTTALFDQLLIGGNLAQPLAMLLRGTALHRRWIACLTRVLRPHVERDAATGGALLLVERKPEVA